MPGFQTQVNIMPAPGVEGDFCDHNPRTTVNAGPGGLVSGAQGVIIGHFAWVDFSRIDPDNAPALANSFGSGPPDGFVHREQQGIITTFLAASGMLVPQGLPVTLHNEGGFWVRNAGAGYAAYGMKAFANLADGSVQFAAAGAAPGQSAVTGAIAPGTFTATGSITGNVLNVTAVSAGPVVAGATIAGTGIPAGCRIVSQITPLLANEALGGIGRYAVNIAELGVASTAINGTYGTLTVSVADASNPVGIGGVVAGGTTAAGTVISGRGTGTGGLGTYIVNTTQTVASGALTITNAIETKWFARSAGSSGELIKISAWPYG